MGQAQGAGGKAVILWVLIYLVAVHNHVVTMSALIWKVQVWEQAQSPLVSAPSYFSVVLTKHFSFFYPVTLSSLCFK
jgi:hypothetical protein